MRKRRLLLACFPSEEANEYYQIRLDGLLDGSVSSAEEWRPNGIYVPSQ